MRHRKPVDKATPHKQVPSGQRAGSSLKQHSRVREAVARGGEPLSPGLRQAMEQEFGTDLGSVRLHRSGEPALLATRRRADAVTLGEDIGLHASAPSLQSETGRRLLRHELTHVLQNRRGERGPVDAMERTARANEKRVGFRQPVPASVLPAAAGPLFRGKEITGFQVDLSSKTVLVRFRDAAPLIGKLTSSKLAAGDYEVHYDKSVSRLIFKGREESEDLVAFSVQTDDIDAYREALELLDDPANPVPMLLVGEQFAIAEDPFSIDDTGLLDDREGGETESTPFGVRLLYARGPVEFPSWMPVEMQEAFLNDDFSGVLGKRAIEGLKPGRGDGAYVFDGSKFPDTRILVTIKHPGSGLRMIEAFHEYPVEQDFYDSLEGYSDFQKTLLYKTFTVYNTDMYFLVVEKGFSIQEAEEFLHKLAIENVKSVVQGVADLASAMTSLQGMSKINAENPLRKNKPRNRPGVEGGAHVRLAKNGDVLDSKGKMTRSGPDDPDYFAGESFKNNRFGDPEYRYSVKMYVDDGIVNGDFMLRQPARDLDLPVADASSGYYRSSQLRGKKEFLAGLEHLRGVHGEDKIKGIRGDWGHGDNLAAFNASYKRMIGEGMDPALAKQKAAMETHTGQWLEPLGYTKVEVKKAVMAVDRRSGNTLDWFSDVDVIFSKP